MSAILNVRTFPSELTAYKIALDDWQKNIRKGESISGDRFNDSMKKALLFVFIGGSSTPDAESGYRCFCSNVCCPLCGVATSERTLAGDLRSRTRQS